MIDARANHGTGNARPATRCWGILARFDGADELLHAARTIRRDGYVSLEAFTPFPIEELNEIISGHRSRMPWIIFFGGLFGGVSIYVLEYWVNLYAYPINIGGRPLHSWPSFIPPAFEGTVLGAAIFAFIGILLLCKLPRLHHPVFEVSAFKDASTDGFFLAVKRDDDRFDRDALRTRLLEIGGRMTWEVPDV